MRPRANECASCRKPILFAIMGGKVVAIEKCAAGRGNIALTGDLFAGGDPLSAPRADVVSSAASHRLHGERCSGLKSFTAGAARKVRP